MVICIVTKNDHTIILFIFSCWTVGKLSRKNFNCGITTQLGYYRQNEADLSQENTVRNIAMESIKMSSRRLYQTNADKNCVSSIDFPSHFHRSFVHEIRFDRKKFLFSYYRHFRPVFFDKIWRKKKINILKASKICTSFFIFFLFKKLIVGQFSSVQNYKLEESSEFCLYNCRKKNKEVLPNDFEPIQFNETIEKFCISFRHYFYGCAIKQLMWVKRSYGAIAQWTHAAYHTAHVWNEMVIIIYMLKGWNIVTELASNAIAIYWGYVKVLLFSAIKLNKSSFVF